ncbi:hypothetical protein ACLB2K_047195 [Fragaria x ananassa]
MDANNHVPSPHTTPPLSPPPQVGEFGGAEAGDYEAFDLDNLPIELAPQVQRIRELKAQIAAQQEEIKIAQSKNMWLRECNNAIIDQINAQQLQRYSQDTNDQNGDDSGNMDETEIEDNDEDSDNNDDMM